MKPTQQKKQQQTLKPVSRTSVELSCHAPKAKSVFVAGTFNDWNPGATALRAISADGAWSVTLPLAPGRYEYKFIVDGRWCCDVACEREHHGCPRCTPNVFGTMNRVLLVD